VLFITDWKDLSAMAPPRRLWHELTTQDFAGLDRARAVAVLPVAAIEQHGPHLPLVVDSCINEGIVRRTLELLPAEAPVLVLPTMTVGCSPEHADFPGSLTAEPETLIRLWTEIGDGVARAGVSKLAIFNSHGGQPQIADIVAQRLRRRHRMLVCRISYFRLGLPEGLFPEDEVRHGIHGGAVETSIMLHLRPELVRLDKAANFVPRGLAMAREYRHLKPTGPAGFAWQSQDLHPSGACGDATLADADKGRQVVEHAARAVAEILTEMARFPLEALRDRPE
jgi:creatinine amidohydrolase